MGTGFMLVSMRLPTSLLTIGQLAKQAGVGIETVRFYERQGLLLEPLRQGAGGYRRYPAESLSRLRSLRSSGMPRHLQADGSWKM